MLVAFRRSFARHPANARRILCAAAFSTLSGSSWGFLAPPLIPAAPPSTRHEAVLPPRRPAPCARRLSSRRDDNDDDWGTLKNAGGNLIKKGVGKIKSLLPFGQKTEEERRQEEIKGSISKMTKDLPLPFRMMGSLVAPLLSSAASQMAEQSRQAEEMLEEARWRLERDRALTDTLGAPLRVGPPFAQSSSTTVINGQSSASLRAQFQVTGTRQSGIATLESNNGEICSLSVNVNGRNIAVDSRGTKNVYGDWSGNRRDDFIEAEIIEKKK